jgi:hypothetical protein
MKKAKKRKEKLILLICMLKDWDLNENTQITRDNSDVVKSTLALHSDGHQISKP